ncbi:MAG: InlB B-repeat-containing protein, partial [Clostridia bacterium]|nr:InlB B-repeat-containing protein [Clostridia bacterium]
TLENEDYEAAVFDATVSHAHSGTVTAAVEPTIASCGLDKLVCDTCGETVYALSEPAGSVDYSSITEDGFRYIIFEKDGKYEAAVTGYTGDETEIAIPSEIVVDDSIDPIPVTAIRGYYEGMPLWNSTVTSVTIPEGIREIGESAFAGYTALEEVTIPDSVLIIGEGAFRGCVNLEGVTIGENVKYIGEDAFATNPDEEDREYFESDLADMEDYISNEIEEYEEDLKEAEEDADSFFDMASDRLGVTISSWDDYKAALEAADLDTLNSFMGPSDFTDKEEAVDFLYGMPKSFFESRINHYNSQIKAAEGFLDACREIAASDDTPLAWVIYNGSEEDFGKIIIEKNNEELTEARTGFDGEDPAFTITYDANGGENAPEAQTGFKDVTLTAEEPEYYGYTFLGWATETDAQEADYAAGAEYYLIADTTLYAVWEETVDTLTYDANGGANAPAAQTGFGEITLSSAKPVREGYEFLGWTATKDAAEAEYEAGGSYLLEEDATLYAVWQKINTLTYDANGG